MRLPLAPLLLAAVLSTLGGCGTLERPQRHLSGDAVRPLRHVPFSPGAPRPDVAGLRQAIDSANGAPVRVLYVHGMREHEEGYSEPMQAQIARRLGLRRFARPDSARPLFRGYDLSLFVEGVEFKVGLPPPRLKTTRWADDAGRERLVVYELLWAPLRDEMKRRFLGCFESRPLSDDATCAPLAEDQGREGHPSTDARRLFNGAGKDELMVGGFGDATLVLGPAGDVLRDDVGLALCEVASDILTYQGRPVPRTEGARCDVTAGVGQDSLATLAADLRSAPIFAITHSLGSFLLMDAQARFTRDLAESRDKALQRWAPFSILYNGTVFMLANQVSLLGLARLEAACGSPFPPDSTGSHEQGCDFSLLRRRSNVPPEIPTALRQRTTYVAFNDADDLLGFELPPHLARTGRFGTLVNVSVRNPSMGFGWALDSPLDAHTRQAENDPLVDALVDGVPLPPVPEETVAGGPPRGVLSPEL